MVVVDELRYCNASSLTSAIILQQVMVDNMEGYASAPHPSPFWGHQCTAGGRDAQAGPTTGYSSYLQLQLRTMYKGESCPPRSAGRRAWWLLLPGGGSCPGVYPATSWPLWYGRSAKVPQQDCSPDGMVPSDKEHLSPAITYHWGCFGPHSLTQGSTSQSWLAVISQLRPLEGIAAI